MQALEPWPSSCGAQTWFLSGTWDLPRPGITPMSAALAVRFLTTGHSGSPHDSAFITVPFTYIMKIFVFKNISNLNIFVILFVRRKRGKDTMTNILIKG